MPQVQVETPHDATACSPIARSSEIQQDCLINWGRKGRPNRRNPLTWCPISDRMRIKGPRIRHMVRRNLVRCHEHLGVTMKRNATLSACRRYRYVLWRVWDSSKPYAMIIGLNPSTADETEDDPTIRRCIRYAKDWGYGGLCMANLFAYRATSPADMFAAEDPIGPDNDTWIRKLAAEAGLVVGAWGNSGTVRNRSSEIRKILPSLKCLRLNGSGEPAHPLYQPRSAVPIEMTSNQKGTPAGAGAPDA